MLRLEPMTEAEFKAYCERSIREFAEASPRYYGVPREEAIRTTREMFDTKVVPQGRQTPGHFLWSLFDGETHIGYLHLGEAHPGKPPRNEIHAWDFVIFEPFRQKGFARLAMAEAALKLREKGYTRVTLNVFGANDIALHLYETAGFKVTQIQMAKTID